MGLIICGMNGSGKSTLGRALAEHMNWRFLDNEDLYFPKTDPEHPFAVERTQDEVERLLLEEVQRDTCFVFAAVRGNYGEAVLPYYQAAVLVEGRVRSGLSGCRSAPTASLARACCPAVTFTRPKSVSMTWSRLVRRITRSAG